jgi:hypothetical protein
MSQTNWGSVADWAAAVASAGASITALYLARRSDRIELKGYFGVRTLVGNGGIGPDYVFINVTNVAPRSTRIQTISIHTGWWRIHRAQAIIPNWEPGVSSELPKTLGDGESAQWAVRLIENDKWLREIISDFAKGWWGVETFRLQVHTTNGRSFSMRPEKAMRERMHDLRKNPKPDSKD